MRSSTSSLAAMRSSMRSFPSSEVPICLSVLPPAHTQMKSLHSSLKVHVRIMGHVACGRHGGKAASLT